MGAVSQPVELGGKTMKADAVVIWTTVRQTGETLYYLLSNHNENNTKQMVQAIKKAQEVDTITEAYIEID